MKESGKLEKTVQVFTQDYKGNYRKDNEFYYFILTFLS